MSSIDESSVVIQIEASSVPSTPSWFGEVVLMAKHFQKHGILIKIGERVRDGVSDTTKSSIFSRSSSGMLSVENARWKPSTRGSSCSLAHRMVRTKKVSAGDCPQRMRQEEPPAAMAG